MNTSEQDIDRLVAFSAMARDIAGSRTLDETVEQVMLHVGKIFGPVTWSLLLRNRGSGELNFVHVEGPGADRIRGLRLSKGQGVAGWVAENSEALLLPDVRTDPRFHPGVDEVSGFVTTSIIAVPLRSRDQVYGVIELINKLDESRFTQADLLVLQTIADLAGIAIERAYYLKAVERMALTDSLTGLANRRAFERVLDREIEKTRRNGSLFALLLIDIDHFKAINDTHGHSTGDVALRSIAQLLVATARKADLCARIGGDEFAVLLPETTESHASFFVRRLHLALDLYNQSAEHPLSLSIGSRMVDPANPADIVEQADLAMYADKSRTGTEKAAGIEHNLRDWFETSKD